MKGSHWDNQTTGFFAAITPHDSNDFAQVPCNGIFVGVTGNVVIVDLEGNAVTFKNVPQGTILPVRARRVNATNTTATDLVALY